MLPRNYRMKCYACKCTVQNGYLSKHEQTFKHLQNVHEIEQEMTTEEFLEQYF